MYDNSGWVVGQVDSKGEFTGQNFFILIFVKIQKKMFKKL